MYFKRRISKFYIILMVLLCVIYFTVMTLMLSEKYSKYEDKAYKIKVAEDAMRLNMGSGSCKIPVLPVNAPEIMPFVFDEPLVDCGTDEDWMSCQGSICSINKSSILKYGKIKCSVWDIIRKNEDSFKYGKSNTVFDQYILTDSDFARADCTTENSYKSWSGILIGIRSKVNESEHRLPATNHGHLNVLWFGLDSMSKNSLIRKLPKSYEYLTKQLHGDVLQGYNIIGDGTPQALIPLLTGYTELELPETRRRMRDSQYVDVYPMIWKKYRELGYVTAYGEDMPTVGTFTYRLNGFKESPTDHYMRTFYLAIQSELNRKRLCLGAKSRHQIMLDYTTQFMQHYINRPKFVFNFHAELSHDSMNLVGVADKDILNWFTYLGNSGILNNTIFIFMSDHGNRFAEIRNTLQGKLEERLPFFSFVFPPWFKETYKIQYSNFKNNLQRLTTPFDVHATLKDILNFQYGKHKQISELTSQRAISLFDRIPANRSCSEAYIEPHWCACLRWQPIENLQDELIVRGATAIIKKLNELTALNRDDCALIQLHDIKWAIKLAPHDNLIRFQKSADHDGFIPDLTASTKITTEIYQIKLETRPGAAIFEATIHYDSVSNQFRLNEKDISRINQYGNQPHCIMEKNPEIRKYCFCKIQLPVG